MRIAELANKKIAVYGYGREGQAVVQAIQQQLPAADISLLNDTPFSPKTDLPCFVGEEAERRLPLFDVLIKSPGISRYRPSLQAAAISGVHITSATRLWLAENPLARTLCVTGTKGKSTTSSLLAHLLRHLGQRVALGGNIGLPLFALPPEPTDFHVLELSSYQTSDLDQPVDSALLLNLFPEHLDWHGSTAQYFMDKLQLLRQAQRSVVLSATDAESAALWSAKQHPHTRYFNLLAGFHVRKNALYWQADRLLEADDSPLPGAHNLLNLCAVLTLIKDLGFDPFEALKGLEDFQPLPHRLHKLGERDGRLYVDDSISTTPESTRAALNAFSKQDICLLAGGFERGLDWDNLLHYALAHPLHSLITLPDNGPRIAERLEALREPGQELPQLYQAKDLDDAVQAAQRLCPPGGVVLLSPGAPSYGRFNDFIERGQRFAAAAGFA